jgi:hypothetical protein
LDVAILCGLVTPCKEDDKLGTAAREVNTITRAVVDAKFGNSFTHRLGITDVPERESRSSCRFLIQARKISVSRTVIIIPMYLMEYS